MSSRTLYRIIRAVVIAVAICGIAVFCYIIPLFGAGLINNNPEYSDWYYPWLIFLWITAVPCFVFLVYMWRVSNAVKYDTVFTCQTARLIKTSAGVLSFDVVFFFAGNVLLLALGMNHPGVLLLSLIIVVFGASLALITAVLSRYLTKAAALQEEADSTI